MSTRILIFTCFCLCCFYQVLDVAALTTAPPPSATQKNNASDTAPLALVVPTSRNASQPQLFTSINIAYLNYIHDSQVTDAGALAYMTFPGLNFDPDNSPINIVFKRNKLQAIDFSFRQEFIFVVEVTSMSTSCLLRTTIGSPNVSTVIVGEGMITDIAVDWLSSNVYLADRPVDQQGNLIDGQPGSIKVTRADGQYSMTLPWDISYPLGLSADSVGKRLFWTNYTLGVQQTVIGVINFDGTGLKVLTSVSHDQHHLAYNPADQRVYWTGDNTIRSIRVSDGGDLRVFITVDALDKTQHIAFYQNFTLWTVESTNSGKIGYAPTANASADVTIAFNKTTSNYTAPWAVVVYAEVSQPTNTPPGPCTQDNGGCQQLCLPRQDNSAQCHCVAGYLLGNNGDCILVATTTNTTTPPPTPSGISPGGVAALAVVFSCLAVATIIVITICIVKRRNKEKRLLPPGHETTNATLRSNTEKLPPAAGQEVPYPTLFRNTLAGQEQPYVTLLPNPETTDHSYRTMNDVYVALEPPIRSVPLPENQYETLSCDPSLSIINGGQYVDLREGGGALMVENRRNSTGMVSNSNSYLSLRSHGQFSLFQEGQGAAAVGVEIGVNHDHDGATQQYTQSETTESLTTDYHEIGDQPTTGDSTTYEKLSPKPEQRSLYISMSRDESHVY